MPLSDGTRLGVYEIVSAIGAGGMGEVYRARDPRLGRDVAIKVLPAAFSGDDARLRRFEQEARAAAALNHPNILAVHDVGAHDGAPYVVSELLEGETLRERLRRGGEASRAASQVSGAAKSSAASTTDQGALPVRKAIEYAVQIARGLAAAHEKGIVHRDLKPENIFITSDARVKILDFGLAKLTERGTGVASPGLATPVPLSSMLPTTPPDTLPGVVLGTIGYMSPEQVRGLAADHRSDLFAFGAILYEMLAGQRAFHGDTSADTMTAILKEDPPDLPAAERKINPALARIVDRCLEKSPAARFQSAGDLAFALDALSAHSGATEAVVGAGAMPATRDRLAWMIVAVLSVSLVAALAWAVVAQFWRTPAETRAMRFTIAAPDGWSLPVTARAAVVGGATAISPLVVSPDGRRVVFIARGADEKDFLWVRPLDTLTSQMLPGTDGVSAPFWSPDSRYVAFFAGGKLKKIDVSGGPPVTVCDVDTGVGGAWSREGVILFASPRSSSVRGPNPLHRVPAAGGVPVAATTTVQGDSNHTKPTFLPDGRHFLYSVIGPARKPIYVTSLDSPDRTKLLDADSVNVLYSQGHLLYLRGTTLMAQPFDVGRLTLSGEPFPVAEPIQTQMISGQSNAVFSVSDTGVLVYRTGAAQAIGSRLAWFDRTGQQLATVGEPGDYADVELSPDGRQASVSVRDLQSAPTGNQPEVDVWVFDLARGTRTRVTVDPGADTHAVWSPDGTRVVFSSNRKGISDLYQASATGASSEEVLLADDRFKTPESWSTDGRHILYHSLPPGGRGGRGRLGSAGTPDPDLGLWALPLFGDRKPFAILRTPFLVQVARLSPDGRWIAYISTESGRPEVYVTAFPAPAGKTLVSTAGGNFPRWRRDGKEIFYLGPPPDTKLMAAAVTVKGATFEVGSARPLFSIRSGGPRYSYDVAADGQRFLVNTIGEQTQPVATPITVVVNWQSGLSARERR